MRFPRGWSRWEPLHEAVDSARVGTGAGAYVIRARGFTLHRAVGTDPEGVLDIGESGRLRNRLRKFLVCATNRGATGHMAGWRYAYLKLARHFPLDRLEVRWIGVNDKDDAYKEECRLLREYVRKHFELPPLNYKFNWQSEW